MWSEFPLITIKNIIVYLYSGLVISQIERTVTSSLQQSVVLSPFDSWLGHEGEQSTPAVQMNVYSPVPSPV